MPRSRVNGINRKNYSIVLRTHFTKAAVDGLGQCARQPYASIQAPLGLLHGFPCYLDLRTTPGSGQYKMILFSSFLPNEDKALDLPVEEEWFGKSKDGTRGIEYTVVHGTVGSKAVESRTQKICAGSGDSSMWFAASELVYDAEGKLQVELELQINQHRSC